MTALPPTAVHGVMTPPVAALMVPFGTLGLSARKAEVARLILPGHSPKATAPMLGNSPKTAKVFRTPVHTKLGLVSLADLFSLLRAALCVTPRGTADNPLIHLF